jgi:iron complex outermembrane receptor protein
MKLLTRLNEAINNTFKPLKSIEVVLLVSSFGVNASSAIALNELDFYGDNEMQSIAIGRPMANRLSPAVTSVMTATDIDRIGARTITEVLEYLPGVHVSQARSGGNIVSFRGISSEANSQVLILINGVPMRNVLFGGKPFGWNMPVKNISHIEVIRGPGSMLYGGDATTGVINIVLKTGAELKGGDAGAFIGNQGTESGWVQYGNKLNDLEFSGSLQGGTTTGYKGFIGQDAQSLIDTQFGTHASQAPGFTNNGRDDVDARIDLNYKDWIQLRGGYQRFNNVQTGFGSAYALDNKGYTNNDVYNVDLSLKNQLFDTLDNKTSVYYLGERPNSYFYNLPIGSFGGLLPKGAIDLGDGVQPTLGIKSQFNYSGIKDHNVTAETGFIDYWIADQIKLITSSRQTLFNKLD